VQLAQLKRLQPPWELGLVTNRLDDCHTRALLVRIQLGEQGDPFSSYPPRFVSTEPLPAAASAPASAPASTLPPHRFTFNDFPVPAPTRTYPWKSDIVTTVFWVGKGSSATGWNPHWIHDNGGADDPYDMSGYASEHHASTLNPFYVALPFNDVTNPKLARQWMPSGWAKPAQEGKSDSACKGRWLEIKNRAGRVCFAQWEDVGPIRTDDAAYVFGPNRPAASRGLDISPAVAKYLGVDSSALLSWRFVDDDEVQPGMWLRYDEQAVLFSALRQQSHAAKGDSSSTH